MFEIIFQDVIRRRARIWSQARLILVFGFFISLSMTCFSQEKNNQEARTPAAVQEVVLVLPFSLEKEYLHVWRKDRQQVRHGYLMVFKVDPALVTPRNAAEPVLYVGNQTAERLNQGNESGFVVVIVPGESELQGSRAWFGTPELPERVDEKIIAQETRLAIKEKIPALNPKVIANATRAPVQLQNKNVLLSEIAAELVLKFSPQEKALAKAWRLPMAKR